MLLSNATFKCPTASCRSYSCTDPVYSRPRDDPKLECDSFLFIDGLTIGLRLSRTLYGFTVFVCVCVCMCMGEGGKGYVGMCVLGNRVVDRRVKKISEVDELVCVR